MLLSVLGGYWEYYLLGIILLPGIIMASWAQVKVTSTYNKFSQVLSSKGYTGAEAARAILKSQGITGVEVVRSHKGHLSDHYDPREKVVALSADVYDGTTIAALGVAAHECGHAIQHANKYMPLMVRRLLVGVSNVSSYLLWPLVVVGLILNFAYIGGVWGDILMFSGVAFFGISVIFQLVTLPVEYNASTRALEHLVGTGIVDSMEVQGAKKVLSAAALTYVAALVVALLNLLRFVLFFLNNRRD